jgi:tRNA pseudouridine13 synthase
MEVFGEDGPGRLPLYRVTKRSVDTPHLEALLASALKSRVSFAGMKDKRAVATQYATPTSARSERPGVIEDAGFRAELTGFVGRPLGRGMVHGNRFRVVVRGCCPQVAERAAEASKLANAGRLPNYFGLQRFGGSGALTHRVGRAMTKGMFGEAVSILLSEPRGSDDDSLRDARLAMKAGRYSEGLSALPPGQDVERAVAQRMADGQPPVKALRAVPIRVRRLYVQAYQSYLFNRALSVALGKGLDISSYEEGDNWGEATRDGLVLQRVHGVREKAGEGAVPLVQLVGYAYRDYGSRFDACDGEVMKLEGTAPRDFYLEEMQEVSAEGGFRVPHMVVRDFACEAEEGSAALSFTLARGEYATVLLREIVKPADPVGQGFA